MFTDTDSEPAEDMELLPLDESDMAMLDSRQASINYGSPRAQPRDLRPVLSGIQVVQSVAIPTPQASPRGDPVAPPPNNSKPPAGPSAAALQQQRSAASPYSFRRVGSSTARPSMRQRYNLNGSTTSRGTASPGLDASLQYPTSPSALQSPMARSGGSIRGEVLSPRIVMATSTSSGASVSMSPCAPQSGGSRYRLAMSGMGEILEEEDDTAATPRMSILPAPYGTADFHDKGGWKTAWKRLGTHLKIAGGLQRSAEHTARLRGIVAGEEHGRALVEQRLLFELGHLHAALHGPGAREAFERDLLYRTFSSNLPVISTREAGLLMLDVSTRRHVSLGNRGGVTDGGSYCVVRSVDGDPLRAAGRRQEEMFDFDVPVENPAEPVCVEVWQTDVPEDVLMGTFNLALSGLPRTGTGSFNATFKWHFEPTQQNDDRPVRTRKDLLKRRMSMAQRTYEETPGFKRSELLQEMRDAVREIRDAERYAWRALRDAFILEERVVSYDKQRFVVRAQQAVIDAERDARNALVREWRRVSVPLYELAWRRLLTGLEVEERHQLFVQSAAAVDSTPRRTVSNLSPRVPPPARELPNVRRRLDTAFVHGGRTNGVVNPVEDSPSPLPASEIVRRSSSLRGVSREPSYGYVAAPPARSSEPVSASTTALPALTSRPSIYSSRPDALRPPLRVQRRE